LLEFVASPYICNGTSRAIDGAFFQTLLSIIALFWVFINWDVITDDGRTSAANGADQNSIERQHGTGDMKAKSMTPQYQPIYIEKLVGMSVHEGVAELNLYKTQFLDLVESEVWRLIRTHKSAM
jgi:hypothetical protein